MVMYADPSIPTGQTVLTRKYLKVITDDLTFLADAISLVPLHAVAHGTGAPGSAGIRLFDGALLTAQYGRIARIDAPAGSAVHELVLGANLIPFWQAV